MAMEHLIVPIMSATVRSFNIWAALLAALFITNAGSSLADERPARVVSVNVCTDQLGMLLAPPEQLVSVSFLAREELNSAMHKEAQNYQINFADIEEIVLLKPDLVLVHEWTSPLLLSTFAHFNIPYERFSTPVNLEDIPAQIERMGQILGRENEAHMIIENFTQRLDEIERSFEGVEGSLTMVTYGPNGWVGNAKSLSSDIIERAGFDLLSKDLGLEFGGYLPLETLVMAQPDVILVSNDYPGHSRAEALLSHQALRAGSSQMARLSNESTLGCAIPHVLNAYEELLMIKKRQLS